MSPIEIPLHSMNSKNLLKQYYGYDSYRPGQEAVIDHVITGMDCLVLMPTGGGKSMCFQIPALAMKGTAIVISPLIALMKDQVDALIEIGVNASFLNSSQSSEEQKTVLKNLENGELKLLYIAPERLSAQNNAIISLLKKIQVSLFAIDESHCISHWGHDFRPDYLSLGKLKVLFPSVPVIALTATADSLTRKDIIQKLNIPKAKIFISSFNRPNLRYTVESKDDYYAKMLEFLSERKDQSGIIYCLSRQNTEDLAEKLNSDGYNAISYHAGLEKSERALRQENFKLNDSGIIVATIAFGMGIDKSNVRYVVHTHLPKNIESYYQETGRAGRDGLPGDVILYYSGGDIIKLKKFIAIDDNEAQSKIMLKKLRQMADYCESKVCRRKYLLNYFDENFDGKCNNCDVCLNTESTATFDGTIIAQKILSAVTRLREKFGTGYLIDFLKGSESKKIREEHKRIPTFGKGKDHHRDELKEWINTLIQQEYLIQSNGEFVVLQLGAKAADVLYNGASVDLPVVKKKLERKQSSGARTKVRLQDYDNNLFENLRALRMEIAVKQNIAPYIVFPDSTLVELCRFFPQSINELANISGFGRIKIEKYGDHFLKAIQKYCKTHDIKSKMNERIPGNKTESIRKIEKTNTTKLESLKLFQQGKSIENIAKERKLAVSTIGLHLSHFILTGELNVLKFISKDKLKIAIDAIKEHDISSAGILKLKLGDDFSYLEINAALNYHLKNQSGALS